MSELRLWIAVLAVASMGLVLVGRNTMTDHTVERVGRRVELSPEVLRRGRSPIAGPPDAPYTLVEFMDYECGPCSDLHARLSPILQKGRIALIVRHFPLRSIHPFSDRAARYALSVGDGPAAGKDARRAFRIALVRGGMARVLARSSGGKRTDAGGDRRKIARGRCGGADGPGARNSEPLSHS